MYINQTKAFIAFDGIKAAIFVNERKQQKK